MRAYEAGIKLAQLEWMSKVADKQRAYSDPDDGGDMSVAESMPAESQVYSEEKVDTPAGPPAMYAGNSYMDMLRNIDREYLGGLGSNVYDYFSGTAEEPGRPPMNNLPPAPQQGFVPDRQFRDQRDDQYTELAETGRGNVPRFDYRAVGQDGMVSDDARFNVQAGNYRKQFNRFRDQFGGEGAGAFQGLNYRDFANALDNRGLRVGDSLDANQIMGRLQNIRQTRFNETQGVDNPAGPVATNTFNNSLDIQNSRGNVANRGSLSSMLSNKKNQASSGVNPATGRNFTMGGSAPTNPSNFKMPKMTPLKRTDDMPSGTNLYRP